MGMIDTLGILTQAKSIESTDGFCYAAFDRAQRSDVDAFVRALKIHSPLAVTMVTDNGGKDVEVGFNMAALRSSHTPLSTSTAIFLKQKATPQQRPAG